jgi:uncharacterized protein (TIGR03083 family)
VPTIVDKEKTVGLLVLEFDALEQLCSSLADSQWELASPLPGWSVRDVVSHVVGTEAMLLGEEVPTVDIAGADHVRNPVAEVNERWVASMRSFSPEKMRSRLNSVTSRRREALEAMSQEDFDAPSWTPAGKDETYGRFMRIRHFDCTMHEQDIRVAIGAPSRLEPEPLRSCLDEVETGLGYIVGRRAGLPDGSRVRIDLSGPLPTTFFVVVDGRAAVVPTFEGDPSVGLEMPADLFLRLTGGRVDGQARIGPEIRRRGDTELAERLATHLAFTI